MPFRTTKELDTYNNAHFSEGPLGDKAAIEADAAGTPDYLAFIGTASGAIMQYDPRTKKETQIGIAPPVTP